MLWGGYDAFVKFPHKVDVATAYEGIEAASEEERAIKWNQIADEKGWSRVKPADSKEYYQSMITFNYFLMAAGLFVALFFLTKFFRIRSSWLEADEKELKTSWGKTLQFKDVTKIDKIKWERKGIGKIYYQEDGASKTFVLDDFKYEREPMGKIMEFAQAHLAPEQIVESREQVDRDDDEKEED